MAATMLVPSMLVPSTPTPSLPVPRSRCSSRRLSSRLAGLLAAGTSALAVLAFAPSASALDNLEHDKAGPWAANLKLGPAIKASRTSLTQFAVQLEIARAIVEEDGYLGFSPQIQFGDYQLVTIPVSFQYDIHLPLENLYAYPRIQAGIAISPDAPASYVAFALQPEFGMKYQIQESFHVGLEPVSLPIYFGDPTFLQYRIYVFGGADF